MKIVFLGANVCWDLGSIELPAPGSEQHGVLSLTGGGVLILSVIPVKNASLQFTFSSEAVCLTSQTTAALCGPRTSALDPLGSLTVFLWVPVLPLGAAQCLVQDGSPSKVYSFSEFILFWA